MIMRFSIHNLVTTVDSNIPGWIPVKRGEKIDYDLEQTPLEVKTDTEKGEKEEVYLTLYDSHNSGPALILRLHDNPHFLVGGCTSQTTFLTELPERRDKVWRVAKLPGPRVQVHCNDVLVVDFPVSKSACVWNGWEKWDNDVVKIVFHSRWDSASDFYRPFQGGNFLFLLRPGRYYSRWTSFHVFHCKFLVHAVFR